MTHAQVSEVTGLNRGRINQIVRKQPGKPDDGLHVSGDSSNYDQVVRAARPYKRKDHERFKPIPPE